MTRPRTKILPLIQGGQRITLKRGFNDVREAVNANTKKLFPAQVEKVLVEGATPAAFVSCTFVDRVTATDTITIYEADGETEAGEATATRVVSVTVYDPGRDAFVFIPLE